MWKILLPKLMKTEFLTTLAAMVASTFGAKLGVPDEALSEFIIATCGLATAYIGGRSGEKMLTARRDPNPQGEST